MCSELLRIPIRWGGVPIFGYGVVLAVWLAAGAIVLVYTAHASGWPSALRAHLPTLVIVAALVAILIPKFFPDGLPLRSYGLMVLMGSAIGILMAIHRAQQARLPSEEIMGLAVAMFMCGAVGARLFYVIEYWSSRIRQPDWWSTLKEALKFTEGGLVIYGAFVGAMLGFAVYVVRRKLPALAICDLAAPSMLAGLALGRIGCLLNGCCYGGESTVPWAITFPEQNGPGGWSAPYADQAASGRFHGFRIVPESPASPAPLVDQVDPGSPADRAGLRTGDYIRLIDGREVATAEAVHAEIFTAFRDGRSLRLGVSAGREVTIPAVEHPARSRPVHPAQIYSSVDAGLLAWLLWSFYPYRRRDGEVFALAITLHPISRFLLECIRIDEGPVFGTGLSISQNFSIVLFVIALGLWVWLRGQPPGKLAFPVAVGEEL